MPRLGHGGGGSTAGGQGTRYSSRGLPIHPILVRNAIRYARNQMGTPYVWGGSAPGGFDCSGLVYWAYRKAGYAGIGRTTYSQITQGVPVSMANLRPGDIVFPSREHEGLYIGNGMVLEAPHTGDQVKTIPLSQFGFLTARRLVAGGGGVVPPRGIAGQDHLGLPVAHPNPQMRVPNIGAQMAVFQQAQARAQQALMAQFAKAQASQQAQFLTAQKTQAAQQRQQQLTDEVNQRIGAARSAQQGLSAGSPAIASSDPAAALYDQRKSALQSVRDQALKRAGIL